jgi:hypothetical protein
LGLLLIRTKSESNVGENSDWADVGEEEQALLQQCRKFLFRSPDSPGGGAKDILFFTPCERWLRICSRFAYDPRFVGEEEMAFRIDSGRARELFDRYHTPEPQELKRDSQERDYEVATTSKDSLSSPPANYWPREVLEEAVRGQPENPYFRSDLAAHQLRSSYPVPDDPREIVGAEESIDRNSLISVLREWSAGWPPEVEEKASSPESTAQAQTAHALVHLTPSEVYVLRCIVNTDKRITRREVYLTLKNPPIRTPVKMPTIKMTTSKLRNNGLIYYSQAPAPRGFIATDEGREYMSNLDRPVS